MKILYFAWLKERVGAAEETLAPPPSVTTVSDLMTWLRDQSAGHAAAFSDRRVIRCAVNQNLATPTTPVAANDEVAFFPPMTGG